MNQQYQEYDLIRYLGRTLYNLQISFHPILLNHQQRTNIYNIRKDGGIVKVIKNGRKVQAYQLVNYTEFDANGRYQGPVKTAPLVKSTQEAVTA